MIDPKVVELSVYNGIPHLLIPVVTDPKKAAGALNWAVQEMENRYQLFASKGVRDIRGYNEQLQNEGEEGILPQIVIIIDELADLMMVASHEVEDAICRIAQKARAAGMHLIIATQRPSVDVITGIIKANVPSRIAFTVSSQIDSRTILDMGGAEKLLGRGDMLYYPVGEAKPIRIQGSFVSDSEIEQVIDFIKSNNEVRYNENVMETLERANAPQVAPDEVDDCDEFLMDAIELAVNMGQISASMVQRKFKVGYARAGRIVDQMEERGIISGHQGSKPRQVLVSEEEWEEMQEQGEEVFISDDDE
jgi:S-DNA-T family DNA segregation ATPase FtsK/SpoIIIE